MIPRHIHFVWIGGALPAWATRNVEAWRSLNPGWTVQVHGEEVLLERYRRHYVAASDVCMRSDLLRYSALQRCGGGWYMDCDFWPFRPLADIASAYVLGGRRMFLAEQHWQQSPMWTTANGVIGAAPDAEAWQVIDRIIAGIDPAHAGRVSYGPAVMRQALAAAPDAFLRAGWPMFFPLPRERALAAYRAFAHYGWSADHARNLCPETGGQVPFMLHLWQGGSPDLPAEPGLWWRQQPGDGRLAGIRAGLVASRGQWQDGTQPFRSIANGLAALGCDVEVRQAETWPMFANRPELVVLWNGRRGATRAIAEAARKSQAVVLYAEHGFFDRRQHSQLDHAGILHWASWATDLAETTAVLPRNAERRLNDVWPGGLLPMRRGTQGIVLVLGQVPGDSQLDDCDNRILIPKELVRQVAGALPKDVPAVFRPHPLAQAHIGVAGRYMTVDLDTPLRELVREARLAVMVNSNAGNECLAWGCPVAAFGPSLYGMAGVAHPLTVDRLAADMRAALAADPPESRRVSRYLQTLACRQYSQAELSAGLPILTSYLRARQSDRRARHVG